MRALMFATATFGLRLVLRLFEKTNNDVTTTASTMSNPLLHVRPPRVGRIACCRITISKSMSLSGSNSACAREKACSSKIKLLHVVRVDATHHSTGPTCLPLNFAERPAVYNIFAATSNIYPPHSENIKTGIKMPYTPCVPKYKPF